METTKVTDRHIIFTTPENADYDVNLGLILGKKHNFIIDTGMGASNIYVILEYLKHIGAASKPIIAVNTHAHTDHILGNWVLEDSLIVSHVLCRELIKQNWDGSLKKDIEENREYFDDEIRMCLPNMVFEGSVHFPEDGISLFHSPGHTEDGISVYDSVDKVLYIGDNFGIFDGVAQLWVKDLQVVQPLIEIYEQYDFNICIPSHSKPYTGNTITLLKMALAEAEKDQKN